MGKQLSKRQRTGQLHLVVRFHTLQKREESAFKSPPPTPPNELIEIKSLSKSRSNPNFGKITKSELFRNVNYLPFFSQRKPINSLPFGVTEGSCACFFSFTTTSVHWSLVSPPLLFKRVFVAAGVQRAGDVSPSQGPPGGVTSVPGPG